MNGGWALGRLVRVATEAARGWFALTILLLVAERITLLATAITAKEGTVPLALLGGGVGVLYFLRAATRGLVRLRAEASLYDATLGAIFQAKHVARIRDAELQLALLNAVQEVGRTVAIVPDIVGDSIGAIVVGAVATVWVPGRLWLMAVVALLCGLGAVAALRTWAGSTSDRYWSEYQNLVVAIQDGIAGRVELVATGQSEAHRQRVRRDVERVQRVGTKSALMEVFTGRLPTATAVVVVLGGLVAFRHVGGWDLTQALIFGCVLPPVANLATSIAHVVRTRGAERMLGGLLAQGDGDAATPAVEASNSAATLAFEGATVCYEGSATPALEALDLAFGAPGLHVVVGPNGSGKSTLLATAVGLVRPASGAVLIDGRRLDTSNMGRWRASMGYLPQRPYLPPSSVRGAMRFLGVDEEAQIRRALQRTGAWDVLTKASHDPLNADVSMLSAGERQRIALARVLARGASFFILDEPDANLDRDGITMLTRLLPGLAERACVIVAAHSKDLVDVADHVIELEGGRVKQESCREAPAGLREDNLWTRG